MEKQYTVGKVVEIALPDKYVSGVKGERETTYRTGDVNITAENIGAEPKLVTKNTAFNKNFGTSAGTVCEGNDSRLSDARTPIDNSVTKQKLSTELQGVLEGIANRQQIDNTIYASQGKIFGAPAGYIRSGKAINKIVFLGNSMTYHDPESYWEVTDLREMAASKPNSGWISLIQQHLIGIFPDIAVYKANCANWERATAGTRTYSIISGNPVAEVKSSGSVATGFTVDDILDDTVDIIIVQVYENCATPSSATDGVNMATDYLNLYNSLKQKSPNAEIYQYLGFWQEEAKGKAITSILNNVNGVNVHPIYAPACAGGIPVEQFKCQTGDPIYNGSGQQITTVTSTVAGHPNDLGFVLMAMTTLYCLYNEVSLFDCEQIIPYISPTDVSQMNEKTAFGYGYLYEAAYTGATFLNYYIVSGQYPLATITTSLGHCVCKSRIGIQMDKNYIPLRQELINISANNAYSRGVALSANNTVFTDWTQI